MICFRRVDKSTTNWICFLLVAKTLSGRKLLLRFLHFRHPWRSQAQRDHSAIWQLGVCLRLEAAEKHSFNSLKARTV